MTKGFCDEGDCEPSSLSATVLHNRDVGVEASRAAFAEKRESPSGPFWLLLPPLPPPVARDLAFSRSGSEALMSDEG